MTGQAAEPAQLVEQIEIELLECDEQRVERGGVVSLRRKVDIRVARAAVGIDEVVGPQPADQVHRAETRSDVAGTRLHDHVERVQPAQIRHEQRARDRIAAGVEAYAPNDIERYERQLAVSGELLV